MKTFADFQAIVLANKADDSNRERWKEINIKQISRGLNLYSYRLIVSNLNII